MGQLRNAAESVLMEQCEEQGRKQELILNDHLRVHMSHSISDFAVSAVIARQNNSDARTGHPSQSYTIRVSQRSETQQARESESHPRLLEAVEPLLRVVEQILALLGADHDVDLREGEDGVVKVLVHPLDLLRHLAAARAPLERAALGQLGREHAKGGAQEEDDGADDGDEPVPRDEDAPREPGRAKRLLPHGAPLDRLEQREADEQHCEHQERE
eukprot:6102093-Pleurochrysis_carterae.AAC.2